MTIPLNINTLEEGSKYVSSIAMASLGDTSHQKSVVMAITGENIFPIEPTPWHSLLQ